MSSMPPKKTVSSSTFGTTKHATFVPSPGPSLPTSLTFTVPMLAGSLARAMALSKANAAIISTLTQGFLYLLDGLIDPAKTDLAFVQDIETLGDSLRTAFSGFLGAGIADLYMLQLGHAFRCNGRELYRKKGRVFDFAYDTGQAAAGTAVVAVEAKGLVRRGATAAATEKATKKGYNTQINPHLGTTMSSVTIVRGYAIGIGCGLKKGATGHLHVEQTEWPSPSASPISPPPSGIGSAGGRRLVRSHLALRNFDSIFRLMGNGGILEAIDAALNGLPNPAAFLSGSQRLMAVRWRNKEFFVSRPDPTLPDTQQAFHSSFGVRCDAASEFFRGLRPVGQPNALPRDLSRELWVQPFEIARELAAHDGGAEFPDGLAYFGGPMFATWRRKILFSAVSSTATDEWPHFRSSPQETISKL